MSPKTYVVTLTVMTDNEPDFANTVEQLARTSAGLTLAGYRCSLNTFDMEDEGEGLQ